MLLSLFFGLLFSFIGFTNMFWGNDPYLGLFIFLVSFLYYLPVLDFARNKIPPNYLFMFLILMGIFILWSSLGVGELFDKIDLMINNFPNTFITGY